jgi:FkbM family methyltransferase
MSVARTLRRLIQSMLNRVGYAIVNFNADQANMEQAMRGIAARHPQIATVIDVGASDGRWSQAMLRYLPHAQYLLIEAQPIHRPALERFCRHHPNAQMILAAAGDRRGEVHFDAGDPLGGVASYTAHPGNDLVVPMISIDEEVRARKLPGPFLIKLDTHGFELPILSGAAATLRGSEAVVMECYNFRIAPECLIFDEMVAHMRDLGFRCIHLADPLHRPNDGVLWQCDLVFARATRPEFATNTYGGVRNPA